MKEIKVKQGSPEWHALRLGRITGTRLASAIGSPKVQYTLMCELIAEQMTEQAKEVKMNDAMERGQIEEGFALKAYEQREGITVEKAGFFIADHFDDRVAFSPDGVKRHGMDIVGGVEIKNPDTKTLVDYMIAGPVVPDDYVAQVMMPFICIPTVEWWDFIAFDARIKVPSMRMMVVRVTRDVMAPQIVAAETKLRAFITKWDETYSKLVF